MKSRNVNIHDDDGSKRREGTTYLPTNSNNNNMCIGPTMMWKGKEKLMWMIGGSIKRVAYLRIQIQKRAICYGVDGAAGRSVVTCVPIDTISQHSPRKKNQSRR